MINQVENAIIKHGLFSRGETVLVAVSGGADSVSLLHILAGLAPKLGIKTVAVHMNHCIRGKASDGDALFVKKLARSVNVPFEAGRSDVPRRARRKGISIEMAAREARYEFFRRTAGRFGAETVATAHTADDQAETVLLKLARGAGPVGLGGMDFETSLGGLRVVRPMLEVSRDQVLKFLKSRNISWREDETNEDISYLRNNVRHKILPLLESALNPSLRSALLRTAEVLRDENRWLEELAAQTFKRCVNDDGSLDCTGLLKCCTAEVRRVVRMWLVARGVVPEQLDFDSVARVLALVERAGGRTEVAGGWCVIKRYGKLSALKTGDKLHMKDFKVALNVPGETILPDPGYRIVVEKADGFVKEKPCGVGVFPAGGAISASAAGRRKIYVRSWRAGDRMKPLGLRGSKKLQDIFVDEKTPLEQRGAVPVFECGGEIVWIPGYRVAEGWQVRGDGDKALRIYVASD